nr:hypothetical protein [Microbacterium hydrocarbonoxydans]
MVVIAYSAVAAPESSPNSDAARRRVSGGSAVDPPRTLGARPVRRASRSFLVVRVFMVFLFLCVDAQASGGR